MKILLLSRIAFTLLVARLKQSIVAATGVTFGITMFITLVSFMTGLNKLLDGLVLNRTPHIRLYNEVKISENQPINNWYTSNEVLTIHSLKPKMNQLEIYNSLSILSALKTDPKVKGVAPKLNSQVFYNVGPIDLNGVVNGIDVNAEISLFFFRDYVVEGNAEDIERIQNSVILGTGVAKKMQASIGDVIQVTTARGDQMSLKVVGMFQSGLADFDNIQSFASLTTTQKLLGVPNSYITDIQVKLVDMNIAPSLAVEYADRFQLNAIDIQTANSQFETGTNVRNIISYAVSITLLVVAGFGIYNILNMTIYEKMDSIAILKAMGFSGKDVIFIFIGISMLIGISGGSLGLVFGYILSSVIAQIPFETEALPTIKTYPVNFDPTFYVIGTIFSLITTFVAGYFPARKAGSIDPVDIIRGK